MRSDIATAIKAMLSGTGSFGAVCGLGSDKPVYPLARVWVNGSPREGNIDNAPDAMIELRVAVQIETVLPKDTDGNTIEDELYNLVDVVFLALQNQELPGRGSLPMVVYDFPGLGGYSDDKPAVYTTQVAIKVAPQHFSIT